VPRAFGRAYAYDVYFGLTPKQDHVESKRVADRKAQVPANDGVAKKRTRGAVGGQRALGADDQGGLSDRV
jgi:hypothetical protein